MPNDAGDEERTNGDVISSDRDSQVNARGVESDTDGDGEVHTRVDEPR